MISTDRCRASFVSWERVDLRGWTLGWLVVSSLRRADFLSSPHWLRARAEELPRRTVDGCPGLRQRADFGLQL